MKKQKLLILTLIIYSLNCAMAQQLPNVSYFMYDLSRTNPGSLGSKDMICASLIGKTAMSGFEGAPTNGIVDAEVPFKLFGAKHGVGLSMYQDAIGFYTTQDIKLGYAFRFNVAEGTLGIGINGGLHQTSFKADKLDVGPRGDENDPNIPKGNQENVKSFNLGAGLFYRSEDIYLGASVLNVYATETIYESEGTSPSPNSAKEKLRPHYYLTAGYNFQLSNPAYEIEPAVQFYSDGVSTIFDLNATVTYNKRIWGGVSYRAGSAIVGMAGFMILDGLKVGYAYDYNTSAISKYSSGGHEVLMNYCFKLGMEKSPQRYRSIRYL